MRSASKILSRVMADEPDGFHSSDYDTDSPGPKTSAKKIKKSETKKEKTPTGPAVDNSKFRTKRSDGSFQRFDNYERTVIFFAMGYAKGRLGLSVTDNGKKLFFETCKVLDEFHETFPISKPITPSTLTRLWTFFKERGNIFAENVDRPEYYRESSPPVMKGSYLDSRRHFYD